MNIIITTYHDTKLEIPYRSQYLHVQNPDMRPRACGITCAYMVLKYFGTQVSSLDEMVMQGMREGGYGQHGWLHDYFVQLFQKYGYACERREEMHNRDVELLRIAIKQDSPVLVSVTRRLWDQRIFHMVVLTGVRENGEGKLEGFFYHDPASLQEEGSSHLYVPLSTFFLDWRYMAIFPSRPQLV